MIAHRSFGLSCVARGDRRNDAMMLDNVAALACRSSRLFAEPPPGRILPDAVYDVYECEKQAVPGSLCYCPMERPVPKFTAIRVAIRDGLGFLGKMPQSFEIAIGGPQCCEPGQPRFDFQPRLHDLERVGPAREFDQADFSTQWARSYECSFALVAPEMSFGLQHLKRSPENSPSNAELFGESPL